MSGIITQTRALKIRNYGGGVKTRKDYLPQKQKGSDYVIFNCPACGQRNKKCIYEYRYSTADGKVSFRCSHCYREVEVSKPAGNLIVTPEQFAAEERDRKEVHDNRPTSSIRP